MKVIKNVLLIDDDSATNYLHQIYLETSNRVENIHTAKSVDQAIEYLKSTKENNSCPEIVFLDINLPAKDGWEFLKEYNAIKYDYNLSSILIMLSTSGYGADIDKAKDYPLVKEYLVKPLSVDIINHVIDKYFESKSI